MPPCDRPDGFAYRIIGKLGSGGMGEVYGAEDTVLGRQVAIKVLPDTFDGDPERLARFKKLKHLVPMARK